MYDDSETKIIGIHVYTLCATRDDSYEETTGVGSQMMKIIKEVGRRVNAEFIKLNQPLKVNHFMINMDLYMINQIMYHNLIIKINKM